MDVIAGSRYRVRPMSNEQGRITRWYAAGTDIEELKLAEQRLQDENVALREKLTRHRCLMRSWELR